MSRFILILLALAAVSGCKLVVMVPRGGEVQSLASGTCPELTNCVHDVAGTDYTETFTAVPNPGWTFEKWNAGGNFRCENATDPVCVVSTNFLSGLVPDSAIAQLREDFYIMPIFTDRAPITDTVARLGKTWAAPTLFVDLSWNDINSVCPAAGGGVCSGTLAGWYMDGWTWASVDEVNALFNSYGVDPALGPGPDISSVTCAETTSVVPWVGAFLLQWPVTASTAYTASTAGWLRDDSGTSGREGRMTGLNQAGIDLICTGSPGTNTATARTTLLYGKNLSDPSRGAFFYRMP